MNEAQSTATMLVAETQPQIDLTNDWRAISADEVVQSPVLQVQSQFSVDEAVPADTDTNAPHHEALIQRNRPQATTESSNENNNRLNNRAYRRPYSVARREEKAKQQSGEGAIGADGGSSVNLKNILKQSNGVSLSEILQQQNLSLEDLLRGKQNALRALQNTAAPPSDGPQASTPQRPAPSLSKLHVVTPRRNFFNGTTRITNYQKPAPTPANDGELAMASNNRVTTITAFVPFEVPTSRAPMVLDESNETPTIRRLPPSRGKPIKEVVSAIRPDLNNSNSRKRLPNLKFAHISVVPTANASKANQTEATAVVTEIAVQSESAVDKNATTSTTTTTTITDATNTTSTIDSFKSTLRDRLAFKSRLRIKSTSSPDSSITPADKNETNSVETSSGAPDVIGTTLSAVNNTTQYVPASTSVPIVHTGTYELNKKLNESTPEFNLVELEDENHSKEVTSLEDLFFSELQEESMNGGDESSELEIEDVFGRASTSRSDKLYEIEKPSSQKIFGGSFVNIFRKSLAKLDVTERNPSLFTDVTSKFVDDKTELLDLLGDRRSGARLVKVLKQRNMTLEELIDHRKRGSSHLHLAEIFHNKSSALEKSAQVPMPNANPPSPQPTKFNVVTAFKHFPSFNLDTVKSVNPDDIKTDSDGASYFTSIINVQPTAEVFKEGRSLRRPITIKIAESEKRTIPAHQWSADGEPAQPINIAPEHNFLDSQSSRAMVYASQHAPSYRPSTGDDVATFRDTVSDQTPDTDAAARFHDPLDLELSGHGFKRNSVLIENAQMPIGVRSAIIASASIVGISLAIFIVIFLIFRWRQRRRRKICYSDRFQTLRGRLPILKSRDASPTKRSNTTSPPPAPAVYCNSRRSSKLNTMDPNSPEVQEYLYDAMRKPFQ